MSPLFQSLHLCYLKLQVPLTTFNTPSNPAPFYSVPCGQFVPLALTALSDSHFSTITSIRVISILCKAIPQIPLSTVKLQFTAYNDLF